MQQLQLRARRCQSRSGLLTGVAPAQPSFLPCSPQHLLLMYCVFYVLTLSFSFTGICAPRGQLFLCIFSPEAGLG